MLRGLFLACVLFAGCSGELTPSQLYAAGKTAAQEGDLRTAVIHFKNLLVQSPDDVSARVALAGAYAGLGDQRAAARFYDDALERGDRSRETIEGLARAYFHLNRPYDLEGLIDEFGDGAVDAQLTLGLYRVLLLQRGGETEVARESMYQLLADADEEEKLPPLFNRLPNNCDLCLFTAAYLEASTDIVSALKLLEQLTARSAAFSDAYLLQGQLYFTAKRYEDAYVSFDRFLQRQPMAQYVQFLLAMTQLQQGDMERAEAHVDRLLSLNKDHPLSQHMKALIEFRQGARANARDHAERSINLGLVSPSNQLIFGLSAYELGQYEQSYERLRKARQYFPDNALVEALLLDLQIRFGYLDDATAGFGQLDIDSSRQALLGNHLVSSLIGQRRMEDAGRLVEQLLLLPVKSPAIRLQTRALDTKLAQQLTADSMQGEGISAPAGVNELGTVFVLTEAGQHAQALEIAQRWYDADPANVDAVNGLALAHQGSGNLGEAERLYKDSLEVAPTNVAALLFLGDRSQQKGAKPQALAYYHRVLEQRPQHLKAYLRALDLTMDLPGTAASDAALTMVDEATLSEEMVVGLIDRLFMRSAYSQASALLKRRAELADPSIVLEQIAMKLSAISEPDEKALVTARRFLTDHPGHLSFVIGSFAERNRYPLILALLEQGAYDDFEQETVAVFRALALVEAGDGALASEALEALLGADDPHLKALMLYARGRLDQKAGRTAYAELSFRSSLELVSSFDAARGLIDSLASAGRYDDLVREVNAYLARHPDDVTLRLYGFNKVLSVDPRYALSLVDCARCRAHLQTNYLFANNVAWAHLMTENLERADTVSALALSLNRSHEALLINRANILIRLQRFAESVALIDAVESPSQELVALRKQLAARIANPGA